MQRTQSRVKLERSGLEARVQTMPKEVNIAGLGLTMPNMKSENIQRINTNLTKSRKR